MFRAVPAKQWCGVLLIAVVAGCPGAVTSGVEPTGDEMKIALQWAETRWNSEAASELPFSFRFDGRSSRDLLASWAIAVDERTVEGGTERTVSLSDPRTGLTVRCRTIAYRDFPALEWVVYFKNTGTKDTPILEDIQAMDAELSSSESGGACTLYYAEGSHAKITDFQPLEKQLASGDELRLASFGGRSSDGCLPFFNLAHPGGGGVALGVGWTGQWAASFARSDAGVRVRAGMERVHLRLLPGEEIRTPAMLLLFWSGPDRMRGQNLWRRLLLTHCTPTAGGRPVEPPTAVSPHGIIGFEATTEANMKRLIQNVADHRLPVEVWWIDAGWFPCPSKPNGWAWAVGNLHPDPVRYPHGLKPIGDAAHAEGLRFLLWFEPERVMRETWLFQNHPEWLLPPGADMPDELKYQIHDGFHLLDLGNPAALAWLKGTLSSLIRDAGIDIYRNDFNMYPLWYWRNGESPDRQGMREIRYITGLYDLFDTLRREHPGLVIDNCASGGRRIDFEMLRRALVLTRSDYLWDPIGQQCHTFGLAPWIPLTGIGAASLDQYSCRSGLGSHYALAADFDSLDPAVWQSIAGVCREHRSLRHLYSGDVYPLGAYSTSPGAWMAWQFHREDLGQGVVQAFRRPDCPEPLATYPLRGLDPHGHYAVANLDEPQPQRIRGCDLMETGLTVRLLSRPGAAVFFYRKVEP